MATNYEQIIKSIAKGDIAPVYVLYGEELYLVQGIIHQLEEALFKDGVRDFNYHLFFGEDAGVEDIISAARTSPMLAPKRLVVVKNIQQLKPKPLDKLIDYIKRPACNTVLVLTGDKLANRKSWLTKVKKTDAVVVRFYALYDSRAIAWIKKRVKKEGYQISHEANQALVENTGTDLSAIEHQLEKLFAYCLDKKKISLEDVEQLVGRVRQYNIFQLIDAIGNKKLEPALHILSEILGGGSSPLAVLAMISRQLRRIYKAKCLQDAGGSWPEIASKIGLQSYFLKDFIAQSEHFSLPELRTSFTYLLDTDLRLKSSNLIPRLSLEFLLIKLCS